MIEINLLPEDLKIRVSKRRIGIESRNLAYLVPAVFGILLFAHICLAGLTILKHWQYSALNNKWQKLKPQQEMLSGFKGQYDVLSSNTQAIQQLNRRRVNWAEKLNKLSLKVPSGIWFNELSGTRTEIVLKASVISLQKEEMGLINKFMDNLRNDAGFFQDLNNLELSSVQRRSLGGYDIVDFVLTGRLKPR